MDKFDKIILAGLIALVAERTIFYVFVLPKINTIFHGVVALIAR